MRALVLSPLVLLAACATTVSVPPALDQTAWQLTPPLSGALAKPAASSITLEFKDGRATGYGGCNSYSGSYTQEGTALTIGPLAATKRGCMGDVGAVERAWFDTLAQPLFAGMVGDKLHLTTKAGQTLELAKSKP